MYAVSSLALFQIVEMRWMCSTNLRYGKYLWENLNRRGYFEDLCIEGVILKWILKK